MGSLTLYTAEENLSAFLETEEGGVPKEMRQEFALALAGANEAALDKRDACIRFLRHVESQIEFVKAEKVRLNDWQKGLEAGLERFRDYLAVVVAEYGKQAKGAAKLEGRVGSLTLRKTPDKAEVTDPAVIPSAYKTVTVTLPADVWRAIAAQYPAAANHPAEESVSKKPLLDALKRGDEIDGAELVFGHDTLVVK